MSELISCRKNIYILILTGFMVNYMLRVNISIAIVEMIKRNQNIEPQETELNNTSKAVNITNVTIEDTRHFNWTIVQKNELLGIFFWGYIAAELPGARMAEIFGSRRVFGSAMLLGSILTMLMPMACTLHFYAAFAVRFLIGISLGCSFPSVTPLGVRWFPPSDRSKYIANISGLTIGVAITMLCSGYLISYCGWESVFYCSGCLGLIWTAAWFYLIYDSPNLHPRISLQEKMDVDEKIRKETNFGKTVSKRVPWIKIFTSIRVWGALSPFGFLGFCHYMFINQLPTYLKDILHFDIKSNGLLSSIPFIGYYFVSLGAGILADKLLKSKKISKTATRKLIDASASIIPGLLTLLLPFWGNNVTAALILLILSFTLKGSSCAGHVSNVLDIAPSFPATVLSVGTMMRSFAGWLTTRCVAYFTKDNNSFESWCTLFWIMAACYLIGGFAFLLFGSTDIQPWNYEDIDEEKNEKSAELKLLKK